MDLDQIIADDALRHELFPVTAERIFMAHAGVAPLSGPAAVAIQKFADAGSTDYQEPPEFWQRVKDTRRTAAKLLGATEHEVALVGPTSLGLNLVALGLDFQGGDQVVYCTDDYPANVYAWMELAKRGVEPVPITPNDMGVVTWELVEAALTDRTRLVALASCSFVSGYQLDLDTIGRELHTRGILFCVDAIQTLGMKPMSVEHIDFLAADSHKWLLGPTGAGVFYVAKQHHDTLRPAVLGSWNVVSPHFIAQRDIDFYPGARRYESGTLNGPGVVGMNASLQLLDEIGVDAIDKRVLHLRRGLLDALQPLGFEPYVELDESNACGIVTFTHPMRDLKETYEMLMAHNVSASWRHDRDMKPLLRFSPHFYNTDEDIARIAELLGG